MTAHVADLRPTIIAKSDQLNADDLIGGPMTITVSGVRLMGDEQPVAIDWEGGAGRPFKPCKTMRRLIVEAWGPDGNAYAGRRMTLYRDPRVKFGGDQVGGIRISHLSHIERDLIVALTVTRGKRAPYTVKPLAAEPAGRQAASRDEFDALAWADMLESRLQSYTDVDVLREDWNAHKGHLQFADPDRCKALNRKIAERAQAIAVEATQSRPPREVDQDDGWPGPVAR